MPALPFFIPQRLTLIYRYLIQYDMVRFRYTVHLVFFESRSIALLKTMVPH